MSEPNINARRYKYCCNIVIKIFYEIGTFIRSSPSTSSSAKIMSAVRQTCSCSVTSPNVQNSVEPAPGPGWSGRVCLGSPPYWTLQRRGFFSKEHLLSGSHSKGSMRDLPLSPKESLRTHGLLANTWRGSTCTLDNSSRCLRDGGLANLAAKVWNRPFNCHQYCLPHMVSTATNVLPVPFNPRKSSSCSTLHPHTRHASPWWTTPVLSWETHYFNG